MIQLLWCTIRPDVFKLSYHEWLKRSESPEGISIKVCVNNQSDRENILSKYNNIDIIITDKPDRVGVAYPSYQLSSNLNLNDDDIIVFASDDFIPPNKWDTYVKNKLIGKIACLMVNDGYQALDFSNMAEPVFSIPIMTFSALKKMNKIIYHPIYHHLCSDAELYLNALQLGLILDERSVDKDFIFEHHHWSNGKRKADINDKNCYDRFLIDKDIWESRKKLSLSERLKVEVKS